jgi:hypothetical protein
MIDAGIIPCQQDCDDLYCWASVKTIAEPKARYSDLRMSKAFDFGGSYGFLRVNWHFRD